jgi:hypothetical protein
METEEFKKKYPRLAKEMEIGEGKSDLKFEIEKPRIKRKFAGYEPSIIDFIRRCTNITQALEIIEYMRSRSEITEEQAEKLYIQLEKEGLRSFGQKKVPGYYERESI